MPRKAKKIKKKSKQELDRIINYLISGGVWFWSGYIIIVSLDNVIGLFWANLIGNAVGITLNFLLERYWVFKTSRPTKLFVATWRYIIYTALNAFLLNYLILLYFEDVWNIGPEIGQFIASAFFTVWNYVWYKAWVFKGLEKPMRRTKHHA
jgi:putative flippase GtrA